MNPFETEEDRRFDRDEALAQRLRDHRNRLTGVLGHVKQDCAVRELGGVLVTPTLLTRKEFDAILARFSPGCGSPIHVQGTNGGTVPCGGNLTGNGVTVQLFCEHCAADQRI